MNVIHYDLHNSDFKLDVGKYTFVFSSELYKNKFKASLEQYLYEQSIKLIAKYNVKISCYDFLALVLYKKIEKRGFLVYYEDTQIDDIKFKIVLE